jgi:putative nucleotidyltransferase with HDIG domain
MAIPESRDPAAVAQYVLSVLDASANTPYIGEPVSQLQHSLQCAALAADASPPADDATQVAALLHDLGQFAPEEDVAHLLAADRGLKLTGVQNMGASPAESVGRIGHETIGASCLRALGFPEKVTRLVGSHVAAKRYLCAVDADYHSLLSDASKKSLVFQGGPMVGRERDEFAAGSWCADMCRLRRWDDEAKVDDLVVRGLDTWREPIERVIRAGEVN